MNPTKTVSRQDKIVQLLGRVPLFQGLPRDDLERIARLVRGRKLEAGELLFREGDPGDKFYIVYSGAVEVLKERPRGDHERLAVKRAGEAFGEMSLLNDAPRSASIRAVEESDLLYVTREQFGELLGGESLAVRLMRGLARALRALDVRFAARDADGGGGVDTLRQFSRVVHRGLLPRRAGRTEGFDVAAAVAQDDDVFGRALWDTFPRSGGGTLLAVLEVKGSGLPPAYLLGVTRALLREVARDEGDVGRILTRLNAALSENLFEGLDECVEVGLLALVDGAGVWSAAGDQPGLVVRGDGTTEELAPHGPPLGILPRFDFGATPVALEPGDSILFVSDVERGVLRGAADLVHRRGEESAPRLLSLLRQALSQLEGPASVRDAALVLAKRV